MGKPRKIILIRHAQSEGNKNRDIHQFTPDHTVNLTSDGWEQAEEAGRTLRSILHEDDTIRFYTSPYRRTRETTEGILRTLTCDDPAPSPFPRQAIQVYEEPRLREQDFGNFQPCSAAMERMWQERADYGHFFYRIPNGESAADAYDRISGFNESLWRSFSEDDFPSVCVLVTHGLMTRVFLMKWYHWSVEHFEDLRNVNHCEFIVMDRDLRSDKFVLQNELRTWSEYQRRAAQESLIKVAVSATQSSFKKSQSPVARKWGGCAFGCNHGDIDFPKPYRRRETSDQSQQRSSASDSSRTGSSGLPIVTERLASPVTPNSQPKLLDRTISRTQADSAEQATDGATDASNDSPSRSSSSSTGVVRELGKRQTRKKRAPSYLMPDYLTPRLGRDGGGTLSGTATPAESTFGDSVYDFNTDAKTTTAKGIIAKGTTAKATTAKAPNGNTFGQRHRHTRSLASPVSLPSSTHSSTPSSPSRQSRLPVRKRPQATVADPPSALAGTGVLSTPPKSMLESRLPRKAGYADPPPPRSTIVEGHDLCREKLVVHVRTSDLTPPLTASGSPAEPLGDQIHALPTTADG